MNICSITLLICFPRKPTSECKVRVIQRQTISLMRLLANLLAKYTASLAALRPGLHASKNERPSFRLDLHAIMHIISILFFPWVWRLFSALHKFPSRGIKRDSITLIRFTHSVSIFFALPFHRWRQSVCSQRERVKEGMREGLRERKGGRAEGRSDG